MKRSLVTLTVCRVGLAGVATGQTVRTWTSDLDQRWSRNGNWSGSNRPDAANEIAEFGSGSAPDSELNANNYTVRGIRFGLGANSYTVGFPGFSSTALILTAQNWANAADCFYSQSSYVQEAPPLDQVEFAGGSTADTQRLSYDQQITPVPESGRNGALPLLSGRGWGCGVAGNARAE